MYKYARFFNQNFFIGGMLCFIALFYTLMYTSNHFPQAQHFLEEEKNLQQNNLEGLKAREISIKEKLKNHPEILTKISLFFLLIFALGILLNVSWIGKYLRHEPLFPKTFIPGPCPWGVKDIVTGFIFLFFAEAFILFVEILAGLFFGNVLPDKELLIMLNSLIRDLMVALFVLWLIGSCFKVRFREIGLSWKNLSQNIVIGLVGYLAIVPVLFLTLFLVGVITQFFSYEPPPQPVVQIYMQTSSKDALTFFTLFVAVLGPIFEEIFFRGFTYSALRTRFGVTSGIVLSSLIFAVLHMHLAAFVPIFVLSVYLAFLYEKTGSLVPSMTVHVLHNLIMVGLTLGFKAFSG